VLRGVAELRSVAQLYPSSATLVRPTSYIFALLTELRTGGMRYIKDVTHTPRTKFSSATLIRSSASKGMKKSRTEFSVARRFVSKSGGGKLLITCNYL
jgi:hypothetical protein